MTFLHGSLIALGSTFVAIPILLHLIMRRKPRHAEFPALRFVTATLIQNQRKLQLRHWALLALRCFALAAAALALARPLLAAGNAGGSWLLGGSLVVWTLLVAIAAVVWWRGTSRWLSTAFAILIGLSTLGLVAIVASVLFGGNELLRHDNEAPISAVFIMDDSARMAYRDRNETRLEAAQRAALELLPQLPPGSDIAILPTSADAASFTADASSAAAAVRGLEVSLLTRSVPDVLSTARAMLAGQQHQRHEIFILSDLTRAAWLGAIGSEDVLSSRSTGKETDTESQGAHPTESTEPEVNVYLVDVGVTDPRNIRLGLPQLPDIPPTIGSSLPLSVTLSAVGDIDASELDVELWMEDPATERPVLMDGQPQLPRQRLRDRQRVALSSSGNKQLQFELRGLESGIRHGRIVARTSDSLTVDDERYFTVATTEPERILLAAGPGSAPHFLAEALAPQEMRMASRARFEYELIGAVDLADYSLATFQAVLLIDPPPLEDHVWNKLAAFVEQGGGLAILLGRNASPAEAFHSAAAQKLLPGRLARQWRAGQQPLFVQLTTADHPMLAAFASLTDSIPWDQSPIDRHWVFEDLSPTALTVLEFRNGQPAILETHRGKGTSLTWTTPLSDPLNVPGRPAWNLLPTSAAPWPFVMLVDQMAIYLTGRERPQWNHLIGDAPTVPAPGLVEGSRTQMFTPRGVWETIISNGGRIATGRLRENGIYRIVLAEGDVPSAGISANLSVDATDLQRIDTKDLDRILGAGSYRLVAASDDLVREISASRVGQEGYPWAILALALLLAAEHVLGNRFYQ